MEREEDIVMAISKEDEYDDDDMKVSLKGDRVVKVGKPGAARSRWRECWYN